METRVLGYMVSLLAIREGEIDHEVEFLKVGTEEEARRKIYEFAEARFPSGDGWQVKYKAYPLTMDEEAFASHMLEVLKHALTGNIKDENE